MPSISSSKVGLLSQALTRLGESPISSLDTDDDVAQHASELYDLHKNTALAEHPWRFALRYIELAPLLDRGSQRTPNFLNAFRLPQRLLITRGIDNHCRYEIYGDELYADEDLINVIYVEDVPEHEWPEFFALGLTYRLSAEFALSLLEDIPLSEKMDRKADLYFKKARRINSQSSFKSAYLNDNLIAALNRRPTPRR